MAIRHLTAFPSALRRLPRFWTYALLTLVLTVHIGLLGWEASTHSPTFNEPAHLVAGIADWQSGKFNVYKVNPPLVRMVAALPVLVTGAKTDWRRLYDSPAARSEFVLGEDFVAANGERSFWLFPIARWACIPFCSLGAYLCFRWARELHGELAGFVAVILWCFSPSLLGHGPLITPDVPAASLGLLATYLFWPWLKEPCWGYALASGSALGLASLSKMTIIVFVPLWLLIWLIYRCGTRDRIACRNSLRDLGMLAVILLVCLYVINLGYRFEGSFTRLKDFRFISRSLGAEGDAKSAPIDGGNRFARCWLGSLPVPLPKSYVLGLDMQKRDFEEPTVPSYLCAEFQDEGWWYYYLYALAIKVPLGTWVLALLAAVVRFVEEVKVRWLDEFVVFCPAVVILVFVSAQTGFSEHMRYVLPAFPFAFIWISRTSVVLTRRHWVLGSGVIAVLAWSVVSSLFVYPHSLSYFNELVAGPANGSAHLIHSNVDWGQDLLHLKKWINEHPESRPLKLAYFGYFDPTYAGIEYVAPEDISSESVRESDETKISPGWYAISVNLVRGLPYRGYRGDGSKITMMQDSLAVFQQVEPVAMAGYSIYIYHIEEQADDRPPK